jgi:hypothetical protein
MKRLQRVSGTAAFTALLASSLISAGCGGTWSAPVIPSTVKALTFTAGFMDAGGNVIDSGTAYLHFTLTTDGATGDETDFQNGTNQFTIEGGSIEKTLQANGYLGLDPNSMSIVCSADVTYVNPQGATVTCNGVPGNCAKPSYSDASKTVSASGTFTLPANGQGCTGGSTGAPPPSGGTGGGTPPGPGTGGPSAYFDILAPRHESNPGNDYNRNGLKPDEQNGSGSEEAVARSARV